MKISRLLVVPVAVLVSLGAVHPQAGVGVSVNKPQVTSTASFSPAVKEGYTVEERASDYLPASAGLATSSAATTLSTGFSSTQTLTYLPSQQPVISGFVTSNVRPRTVQLERLGSDGVWVVAQTQTIDNSSVLSFTISDLLPSTTVFRVHVLADDSFAEAVGGSKTIVIAPGMLTPKMNLAATDLKALPTSQGFSASYTLPAVSSDAMSNQGVVQVLEKFDSDSQDWVAVTSSTLVNVTPSQVFTLTTPREVRSSGLVTYRIHVKTNGSDYVDGYSPDYTVSYAAKTTILTGSTLVNGKTITAPGPNAFEIKGNINSTETRLVELQTFDAKTASWVTYNSWYNTSSYDFWLPGSDAASAAWRIHLPATANYTEASTGSTVIKRVLVDVGVNMVNGFVENVPWVNTTLSWSLGGANTGTAVTVQQLRGTSWVTVKKTTSVSGQMVTYVVPHGSTKSANATLKFRLLVAKTGLGWAATTSSTSNLIWSNPYKYTGVAKTAYNYMKAYCPTTPIVIQNSPMSGGTLWGVNHLGQNYITLYGKIPAKHLQTVSLHECGHTRQWKLYNTDWDNFYTKMNSIYGQKASSNLGMEQNADCIANAWHKNSYFGYKGNCSGAKGTVGTSFAKGVKIKL